MRLLVAVFTAVISISFSSPVALDACDAKPNGFLPIVQCTAEYHLCRSGHPRRAACPHPTVFDEKAEGCVAKELCRRDQSRINETIGNPNSGQFSNTPEENQSPPPVFDGDMRVPIENGQPREFGTYKSFLELVYDSFWPWKDEVKCGAVALYKDWAITAAHCVSYTPLFFKLESWLYLNAEVTTSGEGTYHKILNIIVHPDYNKACEGCYDVALIRVAKQFKPDHDHIARQHFGSRDDVFTDCVHASIRSWPVVFKDFLTGEETTEVERGGLAQNKLSITAEEHCEMMYNKHAKEDKDYYKYNPKLMMCGYSQRQQSGALPGDSGSGVYCDQHNREGKILVGIQSFLMSSISPTGRKNYRTGYPEVFIRILPLRKWITETVDGYPSP